MKKSTGVSMGGSVINAKKPGLIPCDCTKCYHKKRKNGVNYCEYYQKKIDKDKKMCARYYGERVETKNSSTNKTLKTCKKCAHYDLRGRYCNSFNISILSTSTGKYCKNYNAKRDKIPEKYKYKHNSSKTKWNKYKAKK